MYIRSATLVINATTDFNPPYMMYVWVGLKFNQHISIQYIIGSEVGYHKSALCCVLPDVMSLVLEKVTPTAVTNH